MVNYNDGKIYRLISYNTGRQYIGSTCCKKLCDRLAQHKYSKTQNEKGKYCNVKSLIILNDGNYKIELIENFPCDSKAELLAREGYWIRKEECVNKNIPNRSIKEWQENNKESIKKRKSEYYQANKNSISAKKKIYRENNKEKLKLKRSERILCECGKSSTKTHYKRHTRTMEHKQYLEGNWIFNIDY